MRPLVLLTVLKYRRNQTDLEGKIGKIKGISRQEFSAKLLAGINLKLNQILKARDADHLSVSINNCSVGGVL